MLSQNNSVADVGRKFRAVPGLLLLASLLSACNAPPPSSNQPPEAHAPATEIAKPTSVNVNATDADLAREINHLIDSGELASARWGLYVISLQDKRTVFERNADKLFTPASNMKIFPTAVALELLGADYRWRTSVYAAALPDAEGNVNGDIVLYGRGAPDLVAIAGKDRENKNSLDQLANDLYNSGVRRIRGNVVGDESYFRGGTLGDGWQWNDIQWYFGAEASALSINNNETSVNVLPPEKVETAPVIRVGDTSGYVSVENRMAAGTSDKKLQVGIQRGLSDNIVRVWGSFPQGSKGFGARLSVHKPAFWAAHLFVDILKARGIAVDGAAQTRDAREATSQRFDPQHARELAFVSSAPLREIIKATNKLSINLYAELILRTIGRERASLLPPAASGAREPGDDEIGLAVIKLWLERSQVSTRGLALHDGSGLSRLNLVTPRALAQLLAAVYPGSNGQLFRESLSLSGRDGTLGHRLQELEERISAKTGYLTYDTALSGYLTTSSGQTLAFSIICNDETGRASSNRLIDQIVSLLANHPAQHPEKAR
jgi:D-alanyl-D-alanine carboxypeptidase/D-alanyl-D-alanine-endopeptidase (penicillin-binding protein 4)